MNNKHIYITLLICIILAVLSFLFIFNKSNEGYVIGEDYLLSYPMNRPKLNFEKTFFRETQNFTQYKIVYYSKSQKIYSYYYLPKNPKNLSIILLAGGNVDKERESKLSEKIVNLGYKVITIDQRGVGETKGYFPSIQEDYANYLQEKEPNAYLMGYDTLRAYDFLKMIGNNNVIIIGESMGGRIGIISTVIEPGIKGMIAISSSGYGDIDANERNQQIFLTSINPDSYVSKISPRRFVMLHYVNDTKIPYASAWYTYTKAKEPKKFYTIEKCIYHGFCEEMMPFLQKELEIFEKES